ncbi:MAG: acetyl-CoA carboxylase biotin carboxylase subunit [Acidobacteria bacterium]|nr:acetyl-CoA carboxylase biotin carboxylase subunit [Acidobacteriota bacterium]MBV9476442.1 acetyl-CoA carboxylase biotin carboxylase subunit [Acidobacteriota bacterium]
MKVLVANRGEIAVRVIRACRELGYPTVAVYSEPDRTALHVVYADQAMPIGPAPSRESYLRIDRILDAAKKSGADAVHPGYGFLAENAEFARACRDAGLVFIGPSPESIEAMGSKTESRQRMQAAGVPVVPGLTEPVKSFDEIEAFARSTGFPIMIKASAGGGGKGLRLVEREEDLRSSYERVTSEAESFFGDGAVYAEKFISSPRHIEVQVVGDQHGNIVHVGERECTLQRRHQKVVEECPSAVVDAELRERLGAMAVKAAAAVNYYSTGTIECLMGPDREFYFLEMNTRLQVEHPVTEMVWGVDLVKEQLRVARGERLSFTQDELRPLGHAIECRVYAEDPARKFAPSPGLIRYLNLPEGPGVRNDNGVYAGYTVPVFYDPMLSKLIAHGKTRDEAIGRMRRALSEYRVDGIMTTIPFFTFIMQHPDFIAARFDTGFIDRILPTIDFSHRAEDDAQLDAAFAAAAIAAFEESQSVKLPEDTPSRWRETGRGDAWRGRL